MDQPVPPPEAPEQAGGIRKPSRVWRILLFAALILLAPVAVFLCGFCCCFGVFVLDLSPDSLQLGFFAFAVAAVVATYFAVRWLIRVYKRLFVEY